MGDKKNKRRFIRVQAHRLTGIAQKQGKYEVLEGTSKTDLTLLTLKIFPLVVYV